jgi:hypothetical protein
MAGWRRTSLLALSEGLVVVLMHDPEQRVFQLLLPTRRRRWLGPVHPVRFAAGRRSNSPLSFRFSFF